MADESIPLTQDDIDNSLRAAEKKYGQLSSDEVTYLRNRASTDLFFLAYGILGYNRLSPSLHGATCAWISDHSNDRFKGLLKPRGHFKTTVATITDSIQSVLPKDGVIYPYDLGSNLRLLLTHEVHEKATKFLYEITGHFTQNPRLMGLFPELVPSVRKHRINKYELELPRASHWAEPTFDTMGVGGKSQGRHYDIIKLDDIYGEAARDSKAERETTLQWFDNIQSFFVYLAKSHLWLIGTRYSLDDVYAHAMKIYEDAMKWYIRKAVENGVIIFPEEITFESLEIIKRNPKVYQSQYANDPMEGLAEWPEAWMRFLNRPKHDLLIINPGSPELERKVQLNELDIVMIFDPAVSGEFGLVVTGTSYDGKIYVLESIRNVLKPPDQLNLIFSLVLKYRPRVVAIEEVLFSALYQDWLRREMQVRNLKFTVVPVKPRKPGTGRMSKTERIKILTNYFSSGQIFFDVKHQNLISEYRSYGATDDIHILDALAYGPELWTFSGVKKFEEYRKMEEQIILERDIATGYSKLFG